MSPGEEALRPRLTFAGLRQWIYPWAVCLVTGLDYFDNSLFSFFSSYIAGGINASTDELVWSSSSYAVAAVLGILQQQWWIDRIGYRRYLTGCMLFYGAAALLSASASSPMELMFTRGIQGYFIGPMMGACRIMLQGHFPSHQVAPARRLFIKSIVMATALAPLLGGMLIGHFEWRALFLCTAPVALLLAGLCAASVPDAGRLPAEALHPINAHVWPYLVFAAGQGALQIVLQQLHYQLFISSPLLIGLTLCGIASLIVFGYHQWHHPQPLMRLGSLREKAFLAGLALYALYYYLSTSFSFLTLRFVEGAMKYPIVNAGVLIGLTSLVSMVTLTLYLKYSARLTHKKLLIVSGFVLAAATAWIMMRMPADASQPMLVAPLLMRGIQVLFIAIPVANLTFRGLEMDDFTHSYRLKNIVRQLVVSFSTSSIIVLERHRQILHHARLTESVNLANPATVQWLENLRHHFEGLGYAAGQASEMAVAGIERLVTDQANLLALQDGFFFLVGVSLAGAVFALWQNRIR
jgi:MFS family permease